MINKRSFTRGASSPSHAPRRFSTSKSIRRPHGVFNGSRFSPKRGGGNKRSRGEHIDFSRFIKKGTRAEEKPYVAKHTFADFPFGKQLHKNIERAGYKNPRPIQDQAIPPVIKGHDVFGMANTGTGKTAAFLLPLIEKIYKTKGQNKRETVLIMAPTRELALQIESDFKNLAFGFGMFSVACVGGLPIMKQIREIKMGVSFIIGTPGRLRDLIDKKVLDLSTCHSVVLDEADRMLDMGFRDEMVYIIGKTSKEHQTLFFSATLSPEIKKLTEHYLKDPVFISVITGETLKNIDQDVIRVKTKEEKIEKLHEVLKKDGSDKVLIFREMKHSVDTLAKELTHSGFKVGAIHGDKRSRERIRILDSFKKDKINILIATDVAARGLDIPDVTHVINYDVPQTYDTYVHRIGRTGRSGKKGNALTFVPA
ncbi:MAG: DNA/RNA helicase, superfamily II [Candidatus Nomurabacteria bacterium GW2011_GWB1_40_7]|uniref:DNA/RNA helicase, superfamily II n=1 Tax=Candidatus Nomurabacteria bacterium GW2011_GWB1_40_7 TaxID=1618744 RepID=A0A0G0SZ71_9BACT|nr:MAG: DNA/RNA helicase, superfamily II [Candidatus Nomurabacteria bacterium GW2011_GWB1_40_7]